MLIISGPDLAGKSTLVKRCCERLNADGFTHMPLHLTRPPENWDYYQGYLEKMGVNSVWDRFHLDALAYRQCDSHPWSMTPLKYDLVDASVRRCCGYQVLLLASEEVIRTRYADRGDAMYDLEHLVRVAKVFGKMSTQHWCEVRKQTYLYHVDHIICAPFDDEDVVDVIDKYEARLREFTELHA